MTVSTPPAAFASTAAYTGFLQHLRGDAAFLTDPELTPVLQRQLNAAARRAEAWLRRAVLTQTRRRTWHSPPPTCVDLHEPFESVVVMRTTPDGNNTEAITPGSVQGENGVVLAPPGGWGEGSLWTFDYVCGWAAAALPVDVEQGIFQLGQLMYEGKTVPTDLMVAGVMAVARTHQIVTVRVGVSR